MLAERALALVAEVQERLGLVGGDQGQGTIHARPGRRAGGRGEGQSGTERGHQGYPLLLWGNMGSVHTDPPEGSDVSRTPALCARSVPRPMPVASAGAIAARTRQAPGRWPRCTAGTRVVRAPGRSWSHERTRGSVRPTATAHEAVHAGDKARRAISVAYAVPVREGKRRAGTARVWHDARHDDPSPSSRPGAC